MKEELLLLMILSFIGYLSMLSYYNDRNPLKSISAGYYKLPKRIRYFTIISYAAFSLPAMWIADSPLIFFAGGSIMLTAVAAAYKLTKLSMKVHVWTAWAGIALSQVAICFEFGYWWITVVFLIPSLLLWILKVYTRVYWVEVFAFATLILGLYLHK